MAITGWLQWVVWIAGAVVTIALLWLATWGLFSDRPRGRLRCPKCWYDLSHSGTLRCSECGHVSRSEKDLTRTRRRWGPALLAIALLTGGGLVLLDRASQVGWTSMTPTRALLIALPLAPGASSEVADELGYRFQRGLMSPSEQDDFIARWIEGDWWAEPTSETWQAKYGRLIWFHRGALEPGGEHDQRLWEIPADVKLTTREAWPLGAPIAVEFSLREWWPIGAECRVEITPRMPGAKPTTLYRAAAPGRGGGLTLAIKAPALKEGPAELAFDVAVFRRLPRTDWHPAGRQEIVVNTRIVPEAELALPVAIRADESLEAEAVDAAMREVFPGAIMAWRGGVCPVRFFFQPRITYDHEFDGVAIGVSMELLRDGQVARRLRMWWMGGHGLNDEDRSYGSELPEEDAALLQTIHDGAGRWMLRVRGERGLAQRVAGAERCWAGEFTIPVEIREQGATAPPRLWWPGEGAPKPN